MFSYRPRAHRRTELVDKGGKNQPSAATMWQCKVASPGIPRHFLSPNPMMGKDQKLNKHRLSRVIK